MTCKLKASTTDCDCEALDCSNEEVNLNECEHCEEADCPLINGSC